MVVICLNSIAREYLVRRSCTVRIYILPLRISGSESVDIFSNAVGENHWLESLVGAFLRGRVFFFGSSYSSVCSFAYSASNNVL